MLEKRSVAGSTVFLCAQLHGCTIELALVNSGLHGCNLKLNVFYVHVCCRYKYEGDQFVFLNAYAHTIAVLFAGILHH